MIRNFSDDIRDSEIYTELIAQVAPKETDIDKFAMTKEVLDHIDFDVNDDYNMI